jgi:membrane fusion protein (multidrug efflux system)
MADTIEKVSPKARGKVVGKVLTVALFLLGAWFAAVHFVRGMEYVSTDDAYIEGRIHQIAPRVGGTAAKVHVTDNQKVGEGDLLVDIDPADLTARLREAEAAYLAEKARLAQASAQISGAEAGIEVQETALRQARIDEARARRLFAAGAFTREKLEKTVTARDLALAQLKAAQESVIAARANRDLAASLISQREAALETAKLNLGYARIFSPSAGYVTRKSVEEGNQLQPGQPLMAVVALDDVWVGANFKETQLKGVRPGQPVRIHVDMYPGKVFTGKVESIMAGTGAAFTLFPPENALGNYVKVVQRVPVKIVLDRGTDPDHVLRVGMSVVARVRVK